MLSDVIQSVFRRTGDNVKNNSGHTTLWGCIWAMDKESSQLELSKSSMDINRRQGLKQHTIWVRVERILLEISNRLKL